MDEYRACRSRNLYLFLQMGNYQQANAFILPVPEPAVI